ncbi:hypothetical protein MALGJ_28170 [Mycolicibacter algericus]|uniref:J domain-containing protein n=2 Tax=Mycolicibacter algericus TaxID=1288388 RepID=A0A7I9YBQ1_MYCAL|nr:hypothetical protein MALGJ_28170 [Mycolicibacter algericus]
MAMSDSPDPYDVLGVPHSATQAQISHAFRTKVRTLHPDTGYAGSSPPDDAAARLRRLLCAYDALRQGGHQDAGTGPVTIPVSYRRRPPSSQDYLRAGPVRRHR